MSKDRSKEILREISSLRRDLDSRLTSIELQLAAGSEHSPVATTAPSVSTSSFSGEPVARPKKEPAPVAVPAAAPSARSRNVTVLVRPLVDLSLARAVESCLRQTDGVESARLSSLSGDSAVIHAEVRHDVSVVSSLRQNLPVAFDVIESSDHAVSIELSVTEEGQLPPATGSGAEG